MAHLYLQIINNISIFLKTIIFLLSFTAICKAGDNPVSEKIKSDVEGITITITYDSNYSKEDYNVESYCSLPDTDEYVIDRGADKGLIEFPCSGKRLKSYVFKKEEMQKIIKTKYDFDVPDKTDFIFTPSNVYIVHTSITNAGIFTSSDIFILPLMPVKDYETYLRKINPECLDEQSRKLFLRIITFCMKNNIL
jgi:hypothetical protein